MANSRPVLSVVGPVYNEEHSLSEFHARLSRELQALDVPYEIIYVNDGSSDRTAEILRRLRAEDERVKSLHFSRNFGHQLAITAGIDHASGRPAWSWTRTVRTRPRSSAGS